MPDFDDPTGQAEKAVDVAGSQRFVIWLILLQIISMFLMIPVALSDQGGAANVAAASLGLLIMMARIGIGLLSIYGVYKMARSLGKGGASIIYALAMLLPLIGLIILLLLNSEATKLLQASGVHVGFMGANPEDIDRLKHEIAANRGAPLVR